MLLAVVTWLAGVMAFDLLQRRAPNLWLLAGAVLALLALLIDRSPLNVGWAAALTGAVAGFALLLVFYLLGLMGAGDVKFAGALGLWVGWLPLAPIATGAGLLAGVHALAWLLWRHRPGPRGRQARQRVASRPVRPIPYAGYLALTALGWIGLRLHGLPG